MRRRLYLIAYDIGDPERLAQVARTLERAAYRVQYSVFAAELRPQEREALLMAVERCIDPRVDDVRCYPLPSQGEVRLLGCQLFPEGVLLLRNGRNLLRLRADAPDSTVCSST